MIRIYELEKFKRCRIYEQFISRQVIAIRRYHANSLKIPNVKPRFAFKCAKLIRCGEREGAGETKGPEAGGWTREIRPLLIKWHRYAMHMRHGAALQFASPLLGIVIIAYTGIIRYFIKTRCGAGPRPSSAVRRAEAETRI